MSLTSPTEVAANRRETALWQGAGASVVAKAVSALCQLAQVPVAIGYLGNELFGLWMTLVGALAMMAFADLGIGAGVQNEAAVHFGKDRADDAQRTGVNGLAVLGLSGVGLAAVLIIGSVCLPWARWIGVPDPEIEAEAHSGLLVLIILFCANLPLTVLARLAYGLQLGWLANVWYAAINMLTLAVVLAASGGRVGFAGFVAAAAAPSVIGHVALGVHLFRKMGWRIFDMPRPDATGMARLFKQGLPFTLPQLGALALSAMPPVLISATLGPAMVTPWSLCQRLLGLFSVLQHVILTQLWPAFSEAHARGDYDWMRRAYRRSVMGTGLLIVLPQITFVVWGGPAILIWSHESVLIAPALALVFGLQAATFSFGQVPVYLLNSLGRLRGQTAYGLIAVGLALGGIWWGLPRYGLIAGPMALLLAWCVIFLPFSYREASRTLRTVARHD
ncbi:hypothetical protein CMV30_00605 [Nibricoccus aquaticus]|uniref:Polysaccharide biosynthesis protein n=1 Tax=Nibricoccus aquaticus TaxID=2576891 RepID=A0A290Q2E7_9BACT|nr:lipopolysaccharide biosynthesis protein [Nibricoccus aquaticus]ATC62593.1 hypothetical protein CMV30_00605 [Nibricoccus aquaticus]